MAGTDDFGPSRFGRYPGDPPSYTGRRVDLLGRSLPAPPGADPAPVLRDYLSAARSASAKALAAKAVILLTPEHDVGECVWPQADTTIGLQGAAVSGPAVAQRTADRRGF